MTYFSVVIIIHSIMAFAAFCASFFIFSEHTSYNHKFLGMAWLALCVAILGHIDNAFGSNLQDLINSNRVELIGLFFINIFMFLFIIRMVNVKVPLYWIFILVLVSLTGLMFVGTNERHYLFYKTLEYSKVNGFPRLVYTYGIAGLLVNIFNSALSLVNLILIIVNFYKERKTAATEMRELVVSYMISFIGVFYVMIQSAGMLPARFDLGFNPFYLSGFTSLLLFSIVVFKYRIFDTFSIAKEDLLKNVNEGLLIIDIGHRLLFANAIALDLFPSLKDKKAKDETIKFLFNNNKKNITMEDKTYSISVLPFYDKNRIKGYNIWMFDKTEEAKATAKLLELKEQAEEASEAKSVFLANVSHEVRTPMNAIMGAAELVKREKNEQKQTKYINDIISASNSLLTTLDDILEFSKIEKGKLNIKEDDYNLGLVIKSVLSISEMRLIGKDVNLNVHADETIPSVLYGDKSHVRRVFVNVLNNATKYTMQGSIDLDVAWEKEDDDIAVIKVSVKDTGIGISKEDMENLFESFERAETAKKSNIQGFGLGLAITKGLIENMGGEIFVESEEGVGSTFTFYIKQKVVDYSPIGALSEVKDKEEVMEDEAFIAPQARVLVVDDNQVNLNVIKELLDMYKIAAGTAISGDECLKKIEVSKYDMIFMDQMMPGMDGVETTKRIRALGDKEKSNVPIVALTANALEGVREMLLANGFQDYVPKPMNIKQLETVLRKYLPSEYIIYVDRENPDEILGRSIVIPDVDVDKGIENYGKSRTRYLSVLKYIYEDGAGSMRKMNASMKEQDYNMLSYEVHAIKGLAAGIGADEISIEAKALEMACKDKDDDFVKKNYNSFMEKYAMLLANIKYVLKDNNVTVGSSKEVTKEELKQGDLRIYVKKLMDALDLLEQQEAADIIEDMLSKQMSDELRNSLNRISDDINDFEYDAAKEKLSHIKKI